MPFRLFRQERTPSVTLTDYEAFEILLGSRSVKHSIEATENGGRLVVVQGVTFSFDPFGFLGMVLKGDQRAE